MQLFLIINSKGWDTGVNWCQEWSNGLDKMLLTLDLFIPATFEPSVGLSAEPYWPLTGPAIGGLPYTQGCLRRTHLEARQALGSPVGLLLEKRSSSRQKEEPVQRPWTGVSLVCPQAMGEREKLEMTAKSQWVASSHPLLSPEAPFFLGSCACFPTHWCPVPTARW